MKSTALLIAIIAMAPMPTFAEGKVIDGCEVIQVEGTNYFNKADPACVFNHASAKEDRDDRLADLLEDL